MIQLVMCLISLKEQKLFFLLLVCLLCLLILLYQSLIFLSFNFSEYILIFVLIY